MGLFSFFRRKGNDVVLREAPPSAAMQSVLARAANSPLDDHTYRVAIIVNERDAVFDIGIFAMSAAAETYEKSGYSKARQHAQKTLSEEICKRDPDPSRLGMAALAYFDRQFTVGANEGKTWETAWNTLTLEIRIEGIEVDAIRGTVRLELSDGVVDLSSPIDIVESCSGSY